MSRLMPSPDAGIYVPICMAAILIVAALATLIRQ